MSCRASLAGVVCALDYQLRESGSISSDDGGIFENEENSMSFYNNEV